MLLFDMCPKTHLPAGTELEAGLKPPSHSPVQA